MSSTIDSNTVVSTTERTGVPTTSEKSDVNKEYKINNNTQTKGQVSQTY